MLKALFGPSTVPSVLRQGLNQTMALHRDIARKVAGSVTSSAQASENDPAAGGDPSDIGNDMAALADTQIRYEAEAKLLNLVYEQLRTSING